MKQHVIRTATLLLLAVSPLAAQRSAGGQATLHVGEVLTLHVEPGGGTAAVTADGAHRELAGAVRLEVVSNRAWQLTAVADGGQAVGGVDAAGAAGGMSGAAGARDSERPLWYRVSEISGPAEADAAYREAQATPAILTRGEAGRSVVELDYRWVNGSGSPLAPGVLLRFTLSPG